MWITFLIILVSAVLYRYPRGTKLFGSNLWGRGVYATVTGFMIEPSLWGLAVVAWLWLAVVILESKDADYGPQPEARKGSSFWKLEIWGWLTLVPLFGVINYGMYRIRERLPRLHNHLTGWSEYAEILNGATRAASTLILWGMIERII